MWRRSPPKAHVRLLQETLQCQCLELSREHWQLVLRHLRGGPTSDLWWSTTCLMVRLLVLLQGVQMAWLLLVGYRPQVEAKRQSFLSSSHLPVSTGFEVRLFNLYVVKPINLYFFMDLPLVLCLDSSSPGQDYINIYIFFILHGFYIFNMNF